MKVKVRIKGGIIVDTFVMGRFISQLRKEKGMTQMELAEKLNVTDKAVSKWETGRSAPDVSMLIPLSEKLGVTVTEILKGEKISTESLSEASNEVIVKAIKEKKQTSKKLLLISGIIVLISMILALSGVVYHYRSSASVDDAAAIMKQSEKYSEAFGETEEEMEIVKTEKRGAFYVYFLKSDNKASLRVFKADPIFRYRVRIIDGLVCENSDEVFLYSGTYDNDRLDIFYGYNIDDTEYSYTYKKHSSTKAIEDDILLDLILNIERSPEEPIVLDE